MIHPTAKKELARLVMEALSGKDVTNELNIHTKFFPGAPERVYRTYIANALEEEKQNNYWTRELKPLVKPDYDLQKNLANTQLHSLYDKKE